MPRGLLGLVAWMLNGRGHIRAQKSDNGIMASLVLAAGVLADLGCSVWTLKFYIPKASHLIKSNDKAGVL